MAVLLPSSSAGTRNARRSASNDFGSRTAYRVVSRTPPSLTDYLRATLPG
jgi:hypothetical protein